MNAAYVAGFFDGEGCIWIRDDPYCLYVDIVQRDPRPLLEIQKISNFRLCRASTGLYHLRSGNKSVLLPFLEGIHPFLIVKREQVAIGLEFLRKFPQSDEVHRKMLERVKQLKKEYLK